MPPVVAKTNGVKDANSTSRHTPSSSAIHDAYIQMVLKHYGSFVQLGEKPLYQKKHSTAVRPQNPLA